MKFFHVCESGKNCFQIVSRMPWETQAFSTFPSFKWKNLLSRECTILMAWGRGQRRVCKPREIHSPGRKGGGGSQHGRPPWANRDEESQLPCRITVTGHQAPTKAGWARCTMQIQSEIVFQGNWVKPPRISFLHKQKRFWLRSFQQQAGPPGVWQGLLDLVLAGFRISCVEGVSPPQF